LKNLAVRSFTGFIFVLGIVSGLIFSKYGFVVLFSVIIIFSLWEFYMLTYKAFARPQKYFGILIGVSFFIATYLYVSQKVDAKIFCFFIPLLISIFIFELYRKSKRPFNNIAYTILGLFYIALPITLFNHFVFYYTTHVVYNYHILLGFFILLWANDTGAYLVGVSIGRTRLFERVSPKKSWEGFIGGIILALLVAYYLSHQFSELQLDQWLTISILISISATFGDLVESMFKRSLSVKDSGNILPGHGGILDRFDSVLMAAPVIYAYLEFIEK